MIKFFKEYKFLFFFMLFILVIIINLYVNYYEKSELAKRPFEAGVWGTASDWGMIIVTIVTAVFLIKTFIEQKKTNELELKRYIKSIAPKFSVGKHLVTDTEADMPNSCKDIPANEYYLKLDLLVNDARDVNFNAICDCITHGYDEKTYMKSNDTNETIYIEFCKKVQSKQPQVKEEIMQLIYKDVELNEYTQMIYMYNSEFALEVAVLRK